MRACSLERSPPIPLRNARSSKKSTSTTGFSLPVYLPVCLSACLSHNSAMSVWAGQQLRLRLRSCCCRQSADGGRRTAEERECAWNGMVRRVVYDECWTRLGVLAGRSAQSEARALRPAGWPGSRAGRQASLNRWVGRVAFVRPSQQCELVRGGGGGREGRQHDLT